MSAARGGARPGAGNKAGAKRVTARRIQQSLTVDADILSEFKEKYGRGWSRRIEDLMKDDLERLPATNIIQPKPKL
ncbi:hypothetical protein [Chitinophaga sp. sic0106]|uniref:hypothetical protein n=1 Tax=Chitinophaga sp. sic0106 TaxID=2854785 RepID=UPI001C46044E|nr:hypothetical protein [Chitinophaga sp. sic0106]MBV7534037.1 hypothetical protein [Chitinophaga sp. sic0106]